MAQSIFVFNGVTCFVLVESVKTKWRGLRDTFRRELQKQSKKRPGDAGGTAPRSSWLHFSELQFLHNQLIPRQLSGHLPQLELGDVKELPPHGSEDFSSQECVTEGSEGEEMPRRKRTKSPDATPLNKKPRTERSKAFDMLLQLEQKKLQQIEEKSNTRETDADYHFLLSLLPYLNKVDEDRKLIVRTKLQQVFCDEEARKKQIVYNETN